MKRITIEDIAKKANVSVGTVSAVINCRIGVREKTRDHVLSVMKELNYIPKLNKLKGKENVAEKTIGLIIKDLGNPFYSSIVHGVKKYAASQGYSVLLASSENKIDLEKKALNIFSGNKNSGTILAPIIDPNHEIDYLFSLKKSGHPIVLIEKVFGIKTNIVSYKNEQPIIELVKYLMKLGHEKIVHFSGPTNLSSHAIERINGFKNAYGQSSHVLDERMIVNIRYTFEGSRKDTIDYFRQIDKKDYPTAIVCFNDQQAYGVISGLNELGLRVPEDLSVTGFDDISSPAYPQLSLTTIRVPQVEIGIKAAELLIKNIENKDSFELENIELDTELIIRESTKKIIKD